MYTTRRAFSNLGLPMLLCLMQRKARKLLELGIKVRKRIYVGSRSDATNTWQSVPEHYTEPAPRVICHILALSILSFTRLWRRATGRVVFCEVQLESHTPTMKEVLLCRLKHMGKDCLCELESEDSTRLVAVPEGK